MRHVDLFSGIGGFSLAAQWAWQEQHEIISFCEIDKYCQRVLNKHWPKVPIHEDIKTLNAEQWRGAVDLVTGGFPCQPYSLAGKRAGSSDDRALWPEMFRVIEECRTRWVVGENVPGIVTMEQPAYSFEMAEYDAAINAALQGAIGFWSEIGGWVRLVMGDIAEDFARLGYEVFAIDVPACAVDALHIRSRVWILAYNNNAGSRTFRKSKNKTWTEQTSCSRSKNVADRQRPRLEKRQEQSARQERQAVERNGGDVSNADEIGRNGRAWNQREGRRGESSDVCRWSTEPQLGRVANGVSSRVDRLRGLGNAIVPQVAYEIFNFIKQIEQANP